MSRIRFPQSCEHYQQIIKTEGNFGEHLSVYITVGILFNEGSFSSLQASLLGSLFPKRNKKQHTVTGMSSSMWVPPTPTKRGKMISGRSKKLLLLNETRIVVLLLAPNFSLMKTQVTLWKLLIFNVSVPCTGVQLRIFSFFYPFAQWVLEKPVTAVTKETIPAGFE